MATTAAIIARARRDVIAHFFKNKAVTADRAVVCIPERAIGRRALERYVNKGVIVPVGTDTYYLDAPAYERWLHGMRQRLLWIVAAVILVLLAGASSFAFV